MSLSLGAAAILGGAAVGGKAGGSILDTALSDRSAKKADNRAEGMTFRQLVNQMAADRALYDYENQQQYEYAKQYLENSAKWTVQGYRNAGINPIIAANHGDLSISGSSVSMPSISAGMSGTSGGRSSGLSHAMDVAEAMRDVSSVESTLASSELSRSTAKRTETLTPAEKDLMHANADKVRAEAHEIQANTALSRVREERERALMTNDELQADLLRTRGHNEQTLGGASGNSFMGQFMVGAQKLIDGLKSGFEAAKGVKHWLDDNTKSITSPQSHLGGNDTKHSAKEDEEDDTIQVWQDGKGFIRVPSRGVLRNSAKDHMHYLELMQKE